MKWLLSHENKNNHNDSDQPCANHLLDDRSNYHQPTQCRILMAVSNATNQWIRVPSVWHNKSKSEHNQLAASCGMDQLGHSDFWDSGVLYQLAVPDAIAVFLHDDSQQYVLGGVFIFNAGISSRAGVFAYKPGANLHRSITTMIKRPPPIPK